LNAAAVRYINQVIELIIKHYTSASFYLTIYFDDNLTICNIIRRLRKHNLQENV